MKIPRIKDIFNPAIDAIIPCQLKSCKSLFAQCSAIFRLLRRWLLLITSNQSKLQLDTIPVTTKHILWIHISSTSIGDSIMELSGRLLLKHHYQVDLLTDRKNADIFYGDDVFNDIYVDYNINYQNYDLVILDIFNTKSIKFKTKYFPTVPFVPFMGYFYGLDFNRMLFSFHRINKLLNNLYEVEVINKIANNYLNFNYFKSFVASKSCSLVVAIGGEDSIRTYDHWVEVIYLLNLKYPLLEINLLGSKNGEKIAQELDALKLSNVHNYVAQLSLLETTRLIANAKFFLGVDGGLMHIAESFCLSGVALFAKFLPEYRLGYNSKLRTLSVADNVSAISPQLIVDELFKLLGE